MNEIVEIKLNKKGVFIVLLILFILVCSGIMFISYPSVFTSGLFRSRLLVIIGGIFCSLSVFLIPPYIFMILSVKPGLEINNRGLINRSNWTGLGLLSWTDIVRIEKKTVGKGEYILIFLKNSEDYVSRIKNPIKLLNIIQYKIAYNTPVVINPKSLDCTFEELESAIREGFERYKKGIIKPML